MYIECKCGKPIKMTEAGAGYIGHCAFCKYEFIITEYKEEQEADHEVQKEASSN